MILARIPLLIALSTAVVLSAARVVAAETFRLDRIGIVRFTPIETGKLLRRQGVLLVDGTVQWRGSSEMDRPAGTPDWVIDRDLITVPAWSSYRALGTDATRNFTLAEGAITVFVGPESLHFIEPSTDTTAAIGKVINISTRARLAGASDAVIAGFVIDERPRKVLIRGVGPSLAKFGVNDAVANPVLRLKQPDGQTIASNDDWHQSPVAPEIRDAAVRVGAFPLNESSADAALLVELPPGAYTVQLESGAAPAVGSSVLVEVYSVPEV
jgi:hypothetical protein